MFFTRCVNSVRLCRGNYVLKYIDCTYEVFMIGHFSVTDDSVKRPLREAKHACVTVDIQNQVIRTVTALDSHTADTCIFIYVYKLFSILNFGERGTYR